MILKGYGAGVSSDMLEMGERMVEVAVFLPPIEYELLLEISKDPKIIRTESSLSRVFNETCHRYSTFGLTALI